MRKTANKSRTKRRSHKKEMRSVARRRGVQTADTPSPNPAAGRVTRGLGGCGRVERPSSPAPDTHTMLCHARAHRTGVLTHERARAAAPEAPRGGVK